MRGASLVALAIVLTPALSAQGRAHYEFVGTWDDSTNDWSVVVDRPSACMASMSPANMARVPVYLGRIGTNILSYRRKAGIQVGREWQRG